MSADLSCVSDSRLINCENLSKVFPLTQFENSWLDKFNSKRDKHFYLFWDDNDPSVFYSAAQPKLVLPEMRKSLRMAL